MKHRTLSLLALVLAAGLAIPGCSTNSQGDSASPVFFTVTYDGIPVMWNVGSGLPLQIQSATIKSVYKTTPSGATPFLDFKIDDYVVSWTRIDGGKTASPAEVWSGYSLVPAGGSVNLVNNVFMTITNQQRSPLDQLLPFNGGIDRETGRSEIRMKATVTYRGQLLTGEAAQAVGTFDTTFYYAAPAAGRAGK